MDPKEKKSSESISLADLAKKIVLASIGSAAMARDAVTDSKLSKEIFGGIMSKAEKRKDEIMEILAREVTKFLGKVNVADEIARALRGLVINLSASIDFKDKEGGIHPRGTIHKAEVKKEKNS
ncbi:MAG: hypothetical protein HYU99_00780 [Deltaproteobacteria bacterium]|nr:hypothetical protein [Deltaproteobacteria bacterium]